MAKVSEITLAGIKDYCGITGNDSDTLIGIYQSAALSFMMSYTGLTATEIDDYDDFPIAYLCLINDMFTRRDYVVDKQTLNPTVAQILDMHSINYI